MRWLALAVAATLGVLLTAVPKTAQAEDAPLPRVPSGFVVERAAATGAVRWPMFATQSDSGQLFVAQSSGLDLYAEISAGTRRCRISVLEDHDGDGRYESSHVFADGLVFPMGLAWRDGRLYVADPPDLVALEDTDGDGRSDRRTVVLTGFGHTDNGSLHGLTFGPDGLLYMTMGAPDGYRLKTADGAHLEGKSGALLRCRPDGSRPEVLCRGFVNLVEVAFLPGGEAIGTDNWYQEPAGGIRDALVHLVEGGLYPYVPDEGTPQPVTGEPLPPLTRFPAVALSGVVRYNGATFPPDYRGNLFTAQHNARRVGRHVLTPDGSTFRSADSDFMTSEDPEFHPSDVLEDADGSLLVLDTGAWYVQHCPTGRIRPAPAPGGIYHVRWEGPPRLDDPRGIGLAWASFSVTQLAGLLVDPRPAVRRRASRALAGRGTDAVPAIAAMLRGRSAGGRLEAVWTLSAIPQAGPTAQLRAALGDSDEDVASAAARALALRADRAAEKGLVRLLLAGRPTARLAAALALARCGGPESLPAIWQSLGGGPDRFLRHALVYAAHRLADTKTLEAALARPELVVQAAALLLLDQPPRPRDCLGPGPVVARIDSPDSELRRAALHVLMRHPEWSSEALAHIRGRLRSTNALEAPALADLVLAFQDRPDVRALVAGTAADTQAPGWRRAWALETMGRSHVAPLPESWFNALAGSVHDSNKLVRRAAVRAAAVLQPPRLDPELGALAENDREPADLRLAALRAAMRRHPAPTPAAFDLLIGQLGAKESALAVLTAAELAGLARLNDSQRLRLLDAVRGQVLVTPAILSRAFAPPISPQAAAAWVAYLESSLRGGWRPSSAELTALLDVLADLPPARRADLLRLNARALRDRQALLAEYRPLLENGDPGRGRTVFFGKTAACATCHRVGVDGGQIGPDLTRIGAIRSGLDLLESIVWPSSTFAQGFEPYAVATADGRILDGVIARQDAGVVVLRNSTGAETRLRRDEIVELRRSDTSLMPDALAGALTRDELRDLLAFLQSQK
jgi:putative membrane-bound dehydrogenase-like protein